MQIVRVDRVPPEPWKNRGGVTRAITAEPDGAGFDDADWRVDRSDIARAGPFSHLPGIDRILLPLTGGLLLGFDGAAPTQRDIFQPVAFAGETLTACDLAAGSGTVPVLNLMLRRGRRSGELRCFAGAGWLREPGSAVVLYVARGGFRLVVDDGRPQPLDAGHAAVRRDGAVALAFEPSRPWSYMVAAIIRPAHPP
jgi:environmental stress-induced protein Ves